MVDYSVTPSSYPGECTIGTTELRLLHSQLTSNTEWRSYTEEWPPTDDHGDPYPIWFTVDELNSRGELIDSNGNNYNPFAGNMTPYDDVMQRCNAPLSGYKERYPNIRFCGQSTKQYRDDYTYCKIHKGREGIMKSAEEMMQTGLFTSSIDHLYEHLDPWKKLLGWGTFESLMGESQYTYAPEYEPRELDFTDAPLEPDEAEDGILEVKFGYPTDHPKRALMLYVAAMQTVQMVSVQPRIMYEGTRADGTEEGMMESKEVETAQLTAPPSEHDPSPQEFKTIETWSEHHLNLPLSRLIKDQPRLLEMGGVTTDPAEDADEVSSEDLVMELPVEAEPDGIESTSEGTDPNVFGEDMTSESEKIVDKAGGD